MEGIRVLRPEAAPIKAVGIIDTDFSILNYYDILKVANKEAKTKEEFIAYRAKEHSRAARKEVEGDLKFIESRIKFLKHDEPEGYKGYKKIDDTEEFEQLKTELKGALAPIGFSVEYVLERFGTEDWQKTKRQMEARIGLKYLPVRKDAFDRAKIDYENLQVYLKNPDSLEDNPQAQWEMMLDELPSGRADEYGVVKIDEHTMVDTAHGIIVSETPSETAKALAERGFDKLSEVVVPKSCYFLSDHDVFDIHGGWYTLGDIRGIVERSRKGDKLDGFEKSIVMTAADRLDKDVSPHVAADFANELSQQADVGLPFGESPVADRVGRGGGREKKGGWKGWQKDLAALGFIAGGILGLYAGWKILSPESKVNKVSDVTYETSELPIKVDIGLILEPNVVISDGKLLASFNDGRPANYTLTRTGGMLKTTIVPPSDGIIKVLGAYVRPTNTSAYEFTNNLGGGLPPPIKVFDIPQFKSVQISKKAEEGLASVRVVAEDSSGVSRVVLESGNKSYEMKLQDGVFTYDLPINATQSVPIKLTAYDNNPFEVKYNTISQVIDWGLRDNFIKYATDRGCSADLSNELFDGCSPFISEWLVNDKESLDGLIEVAKENKFLAIEGLRQVEKDGRVGETEKMELGGKVLPAYSQFASLVHELSQIYSINNSTMHYGGFQEMVNDIPLESLLMSVDKLGDYADMNRRFENATEHAYLLKIAGLVPNITKYENEWRESAPHIYSLLSNTAPNGRIMRLGGLPPGPELWPEAIGPLVKYTIDQLDSGQALPIDLPDKDMESLFIRARQLPISLFRINLDSNSSLVKYYFDPIQEVAIHNAKVGLKWLEELTKEDYTKQTPRYKLAMMEYRIESYPDEFWPESSAEFQKSLSLMKQEDPEAVFTIGYSRALIASYLPLELEPIITISEQRTSELATIIAKTRGRSAVIVGDDYPPSIRAGHDEPYVGLSPELYIKLSQRGTCLVPYTFGGWPYKQALLNDHNNSTLGIRTTNPTLEGPDWTWEEIDIGH